MFPYLSLVLLASSYSLIHAQDVNVIEPFTIDTNALLYFTKLNLALVDNREGRTRRNKTLTPNKPTEIHFNDTDGSFVLTASDDKTGDLSVSNFNLNVALKLISKQYWTVSKLLLSVTGIAGGENYEYKDQQLISSFEPTAPLKMSFHCSRFGPWVGAGTVENKNFTPQVEFSNFQMEAFMKNNSKFGPSYDCVGFFSIGIWSGIFVTIILLSILSWGITMVMSVKTMDRFDDAKSKPISVGTGD